jgi:4-amino-4-deoxy-L-arabinose transferase-like glycosyltransferase
LRSDINRYLPILAFIVSAWAVFYHLGDFALLSPDEGRNAEVAREMKVAGAWLVPTYNGATYLDKPAFFFKSVALSLALFGDTEAAARLPSALFGFGLLAMVFGFCRRVYDELTASLAMIVVATTPLFMAFSRIVIFDMTLGFFVCAAILSAYMAEEFEDRRRSRWYLTATLAAGVATLVKGPVGFLVPLLVMAAFHVAQDRVGVIKRFFAPLNVLLFLAVVLPWFVGLSLACPDFPYYGIMKESIARFTTPEFRRTQPFYYYGLIIASTFFAWSLVLPESMSMAWRKRKSLSRPDLLFILWAIVVVMFFTLSKSKLPGYILTGVVALGVLTARVFVEALRDGANQAAGIVRRASLALALIALLLFLPTAVAVFKPALFLEWHWLKPEIWEHFGPVFPNLTISLGLIALFAVIAWISGNPRLILGAFLTVPVLLLTVNFDIVPRHANIKSARPLFERLPASIPADAEYACIQCLPHGLPFYLGKPVTVFTDDGKELTSNYVLFSLGSGDPWPEHLVPYRQMRQWLAARPHPVVLLARSSRQAELETIAKRHGVAVIPLGEDYRVSLLPPGTGQ